MQRPKFYCNIVYCARHSACMRWSNNSRGNKWFEFGNIQIPNVYAMWCIVCMTYEYHIVDLNYELMFAY